MKHTLPYIHEENEAQRKLTPQSPTHTWLFTNSDSQTTFFFLVLGTETRALNMQSKDATPA